jgi:glycosyltransferase involved in cell wall biosynthesis
LQVNLDTPLPAEVSIGGGTALFVAGTCFHPLERIRSLAFVVAGSEQPVDAFGMPRLDYFRALHPGLDPYDTHGVSIDPASDEDPRLHSYRSGFWGLVALEEAGPPGRLEVGLKARLDGGGEESVELGQIEVMPSRPAVPVPTDLSGNSPTVAICMATHNPPIDLLRRQVKSIQDQTHQAWVCLVSDDCSRPDRFAELEEVLRDDPRFIVSRAPRQGGFYLNFERALAMVPAGVPYVAMADQDDHWYPEKLETLLAGIGSAQLIYSDARIVGRDGEEIAPSYWGRRRRNHEDLLSLLVANCVTGAASLFRRDLLDAALPFPPRQFAHYHDHWIALVARMLGRIEFVDGPLYDYVQHGRAALGHAAATRISTFQERLSKLRADPRERIRFYRARYFRDVERLMAFATILHMRCGARAQEPDVRILESFLALERSWPALAKLGWRAAQELSGRSETVGAEWSLLRAVAWRRILPATVRERPSRHLRLDAVPPTDLAPRAERRSLGDASARFLAQKIEPLDLGVSSAAPVRINLLIPTIDLEHFFGGYIAKLNLARRLAERGGRVRLVTVDPVGLLPRDWQASLEAYSGLDGLFGQVEVEFGRATGSLEVSPHDSFVATTWWTAHVAAAACESLGRPGFLYLIQEFEPMTFPMGSLAALATQSYGFPHFALFSTELLREYFADNQLGVFAGGAEAGRATSASFRNAITAVRAPSEPELAARSVRRLLFYARPEPHAARNLFELGILALGRALEEGAFRRGWELRGIGASSGAARIDLGGDVELELLRRRGQRDYGALLGEHDVGLALMYTPHPSLVPIEMAAAGLSTVTNTFANKTAEALGAISTNLIAAEPTTEGIAQALLTAAEAAEDASRRVKGSAVSWSSDWNDSFPGDLLERLEAYLAA